MIGKWTWMLALTLGWVWWVTPVPAQDEQDAEEPEQGQVDPQHVDDEAEADVRQHEMERQGRPGADRATKTYNLDRLERTVKKELDLDEDQIEAIEELFEHRRQEYAEELASQKDRMADQRERMGEFLERIREARRTGDQETEKQVNEQIRELHESVRVEQITDEFLADVEKELYDEQINKFRKLSQIGRAGSQDLAEAVKQRPGMLKRYLARLGLDEDTKLDIEDLYEQVQEDMRSGQMSLGDRRERSEQFYNDVMELLSDEQKAQLNKLLGSDAKRSMDQGQPEAEEPGHAAPHDEESEEEGQDEEENS